MRSGATRASVVTLRLRFSPVMPPRQSAPFCKPTALRAMQVGRPGEKAKGPKPRNGFSGFSSSPALASIFCRASCLFALRLHAQCDAVGMRRCVALALHQRQDWRQAAGQRLLSFFLFFLLSSFLSFLISSWSPRSSSPALSNSGAFPPYRAGSRRRAPCSRGSSRQRPGGRCRTSRRWPPTATPPRGASPSPSPSSRAAQRARWEEEGAAHSRQERRRARNGARAAAG